MTNLQRFEEKLQIAAFANNEPNHCVTRDELVAERKAYSKRGIMYFHDGPTRKQRRDAAHNENKDGLILNNRPATRGRNKNAAKHPVLLRMQHFFSALINYRQLQTR